MKQTRRRFFATLAALVAAPAALLGAGKERMATWTIYRNGRAIDGLSNGPGAELLIGDVVRIGNARDEAFNGYYLVTADNRDEETGRVLGRHLIHFGCLS